MVPAAFLLPTIPLTVDHSISRGRIVSDYSRHGPPPTQHGGTGGAVGGPTIFSTNWTIPHHYATWSTFFRCQRSFVHKFRKLSRKGIFKAPRLQPQKKSDGLVAFLFLRQCCCPIVPSPRLCVLHKYGFHFTDIKPFCENTAKSSFIPPQNHILFWL